MDDERQHLLSDERQRLYRRAIEERDSLPIRGKWASSVGKEKERKKQKQKEAKLNKWHPI